MISIFHSSFILLIQIKAGSFLVCPSEIVIVRIPTWALKIIEGKCQGLEKLELSSIL
jgi:hypothetical protein